MLNRPAHLHQSTRRTNEIFVEQRQVGFEVEISLHEIAVQGVAEVLVAARNAHGFHSVELGNAAGSTVGCNQLSVLLMNSAQGVPKLPLAAGPLLRDADTGFRP